MRIIALSDTHNHHAQLAVPDGDVLVHAGDFTGIGTAAQVEDFANWWEAQPHRDKVLVAGNHDFLFEQARPEDEATLARMRDGIDRSVYLQDAGVEIGGVTFYGSPWQPWFHDWAFNLPRGVALDEKWQQIPEGIDVLVTHGPPHGVLDTALDGRSCGCEELLRHVRERVRPRVHVFGHIHEGYGAVELDGARFFNAAVCDVRNRPVNPITVIDL